MKTAYRLRSIFYILLSLLVGVSWLVPATVVSADDDGNSKEIHYRLVFEDGYVASGIATSNDADIGYLGMVVHVSCSDRFRGPDKTAGTADDGYGEKGDPTQSKGHPRVVEFSIEKYEKGKYKGGCSGTPYTGSSTATNTPTSPPATGTPTGSGKYSDYCFTFEDGHTECGTATKNDWPIYGMLIHVSCSDRFLGPDWTAGTADDGYGSKGDPTQANGDPRVVSFHIWKYDKGQLKKECSGTPYTPPTSTPTPKPPTATPLPPTATPTPLPPTATPAPPTSTPWLPTATPVPPTATLPPTATPTVPPGITPSATPVLPSPTSTPIPPTATSSPPTATPTTGIEPVTLTAVCIITPGTYRWQVTNNYDTAITVTWWLEGTAYSGAESIAPHSAIIFETPAPAGSATLSLTWVDPNSHLLMRQRVTHSGAMCPATATPPPSPSPTSTPALPTPTLPPGITPTATPVLPTSTPTLGVDPVQLIAMCNLTTNTYRWKVTNAHDFAISFAWWLEGTAISGVNSVAPHSEVIFETTANAGSNMLSITWFDPIAQSVKIKTTTNPGDLCPAAPTPTPTATLPGLTPTATPTLPPGTPPPTSPPPTSPPPTSPPPPAPTSTPVAAALTTPSLELSALCSMDQGQTLRWRLRNPFATDITLVWTLTGTNITQALTLSPGEAVLIETSRSAGSRTMSVLYTDPITGSNRLLTVTNPATACPAPPPPPPTPTPQPTLAANLLIPVTGSDLFGDITTKTIAYALLGLLGLGIALFGVGLHLNSKS